MEIASCGAAKASPAKGKEQTSTGGATITPIPIPTPEVVVCLHECIDHLETACSLARKTAKGREKAHAAHYLLDTVRDLRSQFRKLKKLAKDFSDQNR